MLQELKTFTGAALALELTAPFTEADARQIIALFDEKLGRGYDKINVLVKVKDMSVLNHVELRGFLKGEIWGFLHFGHIGRCAVVAHSAMMDKVVTAEGKVLRLFNHALEEKYFDTAQLDDAMKFISPAGE